MLEASFVKEETAEPSKKAHRDCVSIVISGHYGFVEIHSLLALLITAHRNVSVKRTVNCVHLLKPYHEYDPILCKYV